MAKKVAKKTGRRPSARMLPSMESMINKPLEDKATKYIDLRDQWQELGRLVKGAKDDVLEEMDKMGKSTYKRHIGDGRVLTVQVTSAKKSVKVKAVEEEPAAA